MKWYRNSWEDFDEETQESLLEAGRFIIPFGVALLIGIVLIFRYGRQQERAKFITRHIFAVVSRKYIAKDRHNAPTVDLMYQEEELYFPGSRLYYDSLQVGDSLYKPAGSTYFYLVEHPNGVRSLRRLLNDSL